MPLTEDQLALRRTGITATDAVVLSGLHPFRGASPHTIYCEKVGLPIPRLTGDQLEMGHELEPVILRRLAMKRGLTLVPGTTMRRANPASGRLADQSHHLATPDAVHFPHGQDHDAEAVAEAKAVGRRWMDAWGEDDGDIPDHVLAQVHWQMHVLDLPIAYVGALLGTEVRTYRVRRDDELIGSLVEVADRFWTDHVLAKRPPPIDGSPGAEQMLRALFPRHKGPMLRAGDEVETRARAYFDFKREVESAQERFDGAKQALIAACGEAEGITGDGWRLRYTFREAVEVSPKPYTRPAGRHFDMRQGGGSR